MSIRNFRNLSGMDNKTHLFRADGFICSAYDCKIIRTYKVCPHYCFQGCNAKYKASWYQDA